MKSIKLPNTDLYVPRFIFGTASLFNAGNARERLSLLETAVDNGFSHFDTAPYYGFGMAERDLAPLLRRHPNLGVTTKVGLYSPGGEDQQSLSVLLRKGAGKLLPTLSRPVIDFTISRAQTALEGSLRRLRRESIELYMLHEPRQEFLNTDEWCKWLESKRKNGQIRHFGVALPADMLKLLLAQDSALLSVVQTSDSLAGHEADVLTQAGRPVQITYGYVSAAQKAPDAPPVSTVLQQALLRNSEGAIIVSTRNRARLPQYRDILESTP